MTIPATKRVTQSPAKELALPSCAICSTTMAWAFRDDECDYHRCPDCDYMTPISHRQQVDAQELNNAVYVEKFDSKLESAGALTGRKVRKYERFLHRIAPYKQHGRLLDIGCGAGRLLRVAAQGGWQAYGVDPAMHQLSEQTPDNVTVIPKTLDEAGFEGGFFDVVHANEVFEHIADPVALVRKIKKVLRPGGLIIFRTPNPRSWTERLVGTGWREWGIENMGHVGFFSPKAARHMLEGEGFHQVRVVTHHFNIRDRWRIDTPILKDLLKVLFKGLGRVATLAGHGERMTVYGERD